MVGNVFKYKNNYYGMPFTRLFIILLIGINFTITIAQPSPEILQLLKKVEMFYGGTDKVKIEIEIDLKYFTHAENEKKIIEYSIIRDTSNQLGYTFYAHDKELNYKQWLCDSSMFILDSINSNIKVVNFPKIGYKNFIGNRWNKFIISCFDGEFARTIAKDSNIVQYNLSISIDSSKYSLFLSWKVPDEVEFFTNQFLIDRDSFYIQELQSMTSWDGMIQSFNYEVKRISVESRHSFCDELNKYPNYLIRDFDPEIKIDTTFEDLKEIPNFTLESVDGRIITSEEFDKPTLFYFWYLSCYPCRKSSPIIDSLFTLYGTEELNLIGINPTDSPKQIKDYFLKKGLKFPTLYNAESLCREMGLNSFPKIVLVDKNMNILYVYNGYSESMFEDVKAKIEELVK